MQEEHPKEHLGCGSNSCIIEKPAGQGNNGPCSCLKLLPTAQRIKIEKYILSLKEKVKKLEAIAEEAVRLPMGVEPHSLSDYKHDVNVAESRKAAGN